MSAGNPFPRARAAFFRAALLGLCVALAAAPAASEPAQSTKKFGKGLLWRVSKRAVRSSYVFGTLHAADPRVPDVAEAVGRALVQSRYFYVEGLQGERETARFFEAARLEGGRKLEALIGTEAYVQAAEVLRAREVPEDVIARTKPWAVLVALFTTPRDHDYEKVTLDQRLLELARENGLRVIPLESVEQQVSMFDGIPLERQARLLRHALAHREELAALLDPTIEAWLRRDLVGVHAASERVARRFPEAGEDYRAFFRILVEDRSAVMARDLSASLREGGAFVAIGADHLYGTHGLLALIERQGYRVERVY